ncbi:DUF3883 domain-containing protein, partial [Thermoflexus sp.]|uniref:DUF3883 domain-containing protein n=1 Tax=Thermoflexus sp. TaxID=1969742 RepID=UPI002ADE0F46
ELTQEALATRHIDLQRVLGEDRFAREHRLVPEYIEQFFLRAARLVGLKVERRADGLLQVPSVPHELRQVSQAFKHRYGEPGREYHRLVFDKAIARARNAVFVAPGHPLLEAMIERALAGGQEALRRGAVFADPDGQMDGWLWFFDGEIRDGADRVAGRRLFAVFQPRNGPPQAVNSSILWDLKPVEGPADLPPPAEEEAQAVILQELERYRAELRAERLRAAEIKRKYGQRSLEKLLNESEARLAEYELRRAKGEPLPEAEILNERHRNEELRARLRNLKKEIEEIERETHLTLAAPTVLGVVRVRPLSEAKPPMRPDAEIEAIGMRVAMEHERRQGRVPEDVSAQNLGYDIRSVAADDSVRYIEVKARATTGPVVLTPNEWIMAQRLGDEYWLYVVENAATAPALYAIRNPATRLRPEEVREVVRYVIRDWKGVSEQCA